MPSTGITRSYGRFIPSFLRNLHSVFHNGCISLHFNQQCKSVPFPQHSLQHLLFIDFLMIAILTGMRWYLVVVLIYISLIMSNVGNLFMFLLVICIYLDKCVFKSSAHFWIGFFVYMINNCMNCLCILEINPLSVAFFAIIFFHLRAVISICL